AACCDFPRGQSLLVFDSHGLNSMVVQGQKKYVYGGASKPVQLPEPMLHIFQLAVITNDKLNQGLVPQHPAKKSKLVQIGLNVFLRLGANFSFSHREIALFFRDVKKKRGLFFTMSVFLISFDPLCFQPPPCLKWLPTPQAAQLVENLVRKGPLLP